jgi:membrane protease YdiL (CAAX protease family)
LKGFLVATLLGMTLAVLAPPAAAADPDPHLGTAMLWSLLPGAGHIYLGDTGTGLAYAGLTAAFLGGAWEVGRRNDDLGRDDEVNVPLLLADKVWEYSIFTTARSALARDGVDLRAARLDDTPTSQLLAAPFGRQALRPPVWGAALFGVAIGAAAAHHRDGGRLIDVERARMLGASYPRDEATALYAASTLGVSLGAATAEEGLFRGMLQPVLQRRWGEPGGRWATAGLFGAAHIVGLDGELNIEGALFATGAGAYLGWLYDHDGARLAGPIAAHFWYDFALLATTWALEPDETPFGFDVQFRF